MFHIRYYPTTLQDTLDFLERANMLVDADYVDHIVREHRDSGNPFYESAAAVEIISTCLYRCPWLSTQTRRSPRSRA